jgi:hypothetical protein
MPTTTLKALLFSAILLIGALAAADDRALRPGVAAGPGPAHASAAEPASDPQGARPDAADDRASQDYPLLSTLVALGLGIVGLLWVRRHTAEL